jgi:hypothetical protein
MARNMANNRCLVELVFIKIEYQRVMNTGLCDLDGLHGFAVSRLGQTSNHMVQKVIAKTVEMVPMLTAFSGNRIKWTGPIRVCTPTFKSGRIETIISYRREGK